MSAHSDSPGAEGARPQTAGTDPETIDLDELRTRADILALDDLFTPEERAFRDAARTFADEQIRPSIASWYEDAVFPRHLARACGEAGLLGIHLDSPGCPGRSAIDYGLAAMELEAADSGIRTFISVQGSLAMGAIHHWGSPAQRAEHLPEMAAGRRIGCFGLTEPDAGSDPSGMQTTAVRDGDDWVLSGAKRWIGLASIADIAIIWARAARTDISPSDTDSPSGSSPSDSSPSDSTVLGFIVPTDAPGFTAHPITPKLAMRASVQCDIDLDAVRVPDSARLPDAQGLKAPFTCLNDARYGIMWGVLGAARDAYEDALQHALTRRQFDQPLARFQLTQAKLVEMAVGIQQGLLVAERTGRLKDAGRLDHTSISLGKLANTRAAIDICRSARTILGGNGITLDHAAMRHANNLEAVRTYEGTDEVHTLTLGRRLTGLDAFRAD